MEYNSKSLTRAGAALFANADANKQPLIVDKVVVSDKVIPAGTDISTLTLDDFANAQQFDANNVTQSDNTFTVTSVLSNENLKTDLSLALIGILAHLGTDTSTQTIIGVAIGNDPFVLPTFNGTPFRLVPSITMGFSASQNVVLQVNDDVYVTQKDLQSIMKSQGFQTDADVAKALANYAPKQYVDDAIKAIPQPDTSTWQKQKLTNDDGSPLVSIKDTDDAQAILTGIATKPGAGSIFISGKAKNAGSMYDMRGFYISDGTVATINGITSYGNFLGVCTNTKLTWATGATMVDVNNGIQKAVDQAHADMIAELNKRGYPSLVWKGTQAEFDALATKDPNGEYQIVEGS